MALGGSFMTKKEIVAMLLAGGQGSRLGVLTQHIAKPAVLYGGKYRIIDFSLSNCVNSGIDTVGVLTQYEPLRLNAHIGIGKPWDLDRMNGGVTILAPYTSTERGEWYKGTAHAVFQNIPYIDSMSPEYVIILSGDHIYKMNYSLMLDYHKRNNADATISVIEVPIEEANRFGIMNTHENGQIYEFEEKPNNPKSNLASMGIYIFSWKVLREYLVDDDKLPDSEHDFGKNIIPTMLKNNKSMWAYRFKGYWRDVGTLDAYWESNMDLIKRVPDFNLFDPFWRIYTPSHVKPAHFISPTGNVKKSIIGEGCMIYGEVINSVVFPGVWVNEGAVIKDSIIMSDTLINKNTFIDKSIIGENTIIGQNVKVGFGSFAENTYNSKVYTSDITVIGSDSCIPDNVSLGKNVVIDNYVTGEDFTNIDIPSGNSIIKGGDSK